MVNIHDEIGSIWNGLCRKRSTSSYLFNRELKLCCVRLYHAVHANISHTTLILIKWNRGHRIIP